MAVPRKRQDAGLIVALALWAVLAYLVAWPGWIAAALLLVALLVLHWAVVRGGGWRLLGPHLYFDMIRIARKGRAVLFRVLFLLVLIGGIGYAYEKHGPGKPIVPNAIPRKRIQFEPQPRAPTLGELRDQLAAFNARCVYNWFLLQNLAILILAPAYLGGAIAEERERGTLEMLAASQLNNREIVLGKLAARLIHLGGLLLAGLPIFCMMLVWGGVDTTLLLVNWINSVLLLFTVSSLCLAISTVPLNSTACVVLSYAAVAVPALCGAGNSSGFPLVVDVWAAPNAATGFVLTSYGSLILLFLFLAVRALRPRAMPPLRAPIQNGAEPISLEYANRPVSPMLALSAIAEVAESDVRGSRLPPVKDNPLLWKERYTGRRTLLHRPVVLLLGGTLLSLVALTHVTATIDRVIAERPPTWSQAMVLLTEMWGRAVYLAYGGCLACYVMGVAFRAAACVARERHLKTLDTLLLIPVERNEILRAKWQGALLKGWPWLTLLACDVALGVGIGAYHPCSVPFLLFYPWALVVCLCSLGVMISVMFRTVLQANMAMALSLVGLAVLVGAIGPGNPLEYASLNFTRRDQPSNLGDGLLVCVLIPTALLLAAFTFWSVASILFQRTEAWHRGDQSRLR